MKSISLKETLYKKNVNELKNILSVYNIKGYSKLRKDELVAKCIEAMPQKDNFKEYALIIPSEIWEIFRTVAESDEGVTLKEEYIEYAALESIGYLYKEKCGDEYCFVVPEEIKKVYNEAVEEGFLNVKAFSQLINLYAQAAANLYGVIKIDELVEIFNSQNQVQTNAEISRAICKSCSHVSEYCIWEDYIVIKDLKDNDFESAKNLIRDTENKPRYIPQKNEFLKYSDFAYFENTNELTQLSEFLVNKCNVSKLIINRIMFDLHWQMAEEASFQEYFDILEENKIVLEENQVEEFIACLNNCVNNTRLWANKGYTSNELVKYYRRKQQRVQKIGRNEPCPCGSGKKYKKCCGR